MKIKEILKKLSIQDIDGCCLYLLAVNFNLQTDNISVNDNDLSILFINKFIIRAGKKFKININLFEPDIQDKYETFRDIFGKGNRGDKKIVIKKVNRWLNNNPEISFDKLLDLATMWVDEKGKFAGNANYFCYKRTEEGEISRASNIVEEVDDDFSQTI